MDHFFIRNTKYYIRIGIITEKIGMVSLRIPPIDQDDHFLIGTKKMKTNP